MTDEELRKEADDYADKHAFRVPYDGSNKFYDDVDFKASKEGYLAGAKPREKRIEELEAQIEKMKRCENCKYNSYWGNELHCNYGLKEAIQEDKLVECKKMNKWEMPE